MLNKIKNLAYNLEDPASPESRGAKYPPFDPLRINISKIPDGMRNKNTFANYTDVDEKHIFIDFNWITQDSFDREDFEKFISEVKRCIEYNINYYNITLDKPILVHVGALSRDGSEYGEEEAILNFESDSFIESLDNKDIYYYGFIGGEAGNYFDGDYFEIVRNEDNTYSWRDHDLTHSSGNRKFDSRRQAKYDAIKTLTPDDGSKFIVRRDPDELYDLVYPEVNYDDIPEDDL